MSDVNDVTQRSADGNVINVTITRQSAWKHEIWPCVADEGSIGGVGGVNRYIVRWLIGEKNLSQEIEIKWSSVE